MMELLDAAQKTGGFATKKATVNRALAEFVQRRKAMEIIDLFETENYDENYDYKAERIHDRKNIG